MNCQEVNNQIQAFIDNEMELKQIKKLIEHLETCESCRNEYHSQLEVDRTLKGVDFPMPPQDWFEKRLKSKPRKIWSGIGMLFFISTYVLLLAYALFTFFISSDVDMIQKILLGGMSFGMIVLLIVTVRDRIIEKKDDRYDEVIR